MNFFQWYQDPLTLWEKVRLFFKRTQTMFDPDFFGSPHIVKFKTLGGKIYVLDADPLRDAKGLPINKQRWKTISFQEFFGVPDPHQRNV